MIDFKEIESPDDFEIFARDFFAHIGYTIEQEPAVGIDGGIDVKISRTLIGIDGLEVKQYWLVSCKHYANSKKSRSVGVNDETDISDRLVLHGCDGFICFYSTTISTGLQHKINSLKGKTQKLFLEYTKIQIEDELKNSKKLESVFIKYFPESFKKWKINKQLKKPLGLFDYYLKNRFSQQYSSNSWPPPKEFTSYLRVLIFAIGDNELHLFNAFYNFDSISECLQSRSVKLIVDDCVNHDLTFCQWSEKENQSIFLKTRFNLVDLGKPLNFGVQDFSEITLNYSEKGTGYYMVYENVIFMNQLYFQHFEDLFLEVKELIKDL